MLQIERKSMDHDMLKVTNDNNNNDDMDAFASTPKTMM